MSEPRTRKDGAKYHSMTLMMAAYLEPGEAQRGYHDRVLRRLEMAVVEESRDRACCRDTDVAAATRLRPWLVSSS